MEFTMAIRNDKRLRARVLCVDGLGNESTTVGNRIRASIRGLIWMLRT
jgi:hypothetical protein